jgi:Ulp1 family protease
MEGETEEWTTQNTEHMEGEAEEWTTQNTEPVVYTYGPIHIRQSDLDSLMRPDILNDEILNFYFTYVFTSIHNNKKQNTCNLLVSYLYTEGGLPAEKLRHSFMFPTFFWTIFTNLNDKRNILQRKSWCPRDLFERYKHLLIPIHTRYVPQCLLGI